MELLYLIFDRSDEDGGRAGFDAMATVLPQRLPALLAEVAAVLGWAQQAFGAPVDDAGDGTGAGAGDGGAGEWGFALHGTTEAGAPWQVAWDTARGTLAHGAPAPGRTTLALTVSGSRGFCEAFAEAFVPDAA